MRGIFFYYLYLILFWGLVRRFVSLPEVIEELWLKPIIWLVPLMLWNLSLNKRIIIFGTKNWIASVAYGLIIGLLYIFVTSGFRIGEFRLEADYFGIALSIAITEEIVFSGFIFGFLSRIIKSRLSVLLVTSFLAAGSHIPMMLFGYSLSFFDLLPPLLFVFGYSLVNVTIRAVSGSVFGSIVARTILILSVL